LAAIIVLAMMALVVLLVYQEIEERSDEKRAGEENLRRLATFAAYAERERFETAERPSCSLCSPKRSGWLR
jgi:hypothetical protein